MALATVPQVDERYEWVRGTGADDSPTSVIVVGVVTWREFTFVMYVRERDKQRHPFAKPLDLFRQGYPTRLGSA
jgi:hypothetical protein